jgi:hypothetical protein
LSLNFGADSSSFVATTTAGVYFYTFAHGLIKGELGSGGNGASGALPASAYVDDILFTGTYSGEILQWTSHSVKGTLPRAHHAAVYAMAPRYRKKGFVSGCKNGLVALWLTGDKGTTRESTLDLKQEDLKSFRPSVKALVEHPKSGRLLVGTRGGEIIELHAEGLEKPKILLKSHSD